MTLLDMRPARLDLHVRRGDDYNLVLNWPEDLGDRTFEASLLAASLTVDLAGQVMTVVIPDSVTGAIISGATWELRETTGGPDDDLTLIVGRVLASNSGTAGSGREAAVQLVAGTVTVTVVGGVPASVVALQEEIADEAAEREAQDLLLIPLAQKAAANGVATLGADVKIPAAQIPNLYAADNAVVKLTGDQTIAGAKDFTTAPTVNGSPLGASAPLTLTAPAAANVPLTLVGAASQSGDLFRVRNSAAADLVRITKEGQFRLADHMILKRTPWSDPKWYGLIGDGTLRALTTQGYNDASAQAAFPTIGTNNLVSPVLDADDQVDWTALQSTIDNATGSAYPLTQLGGAAGTVRTPGHIRLLAAVSSRVNRPLRIQSTEGLHLEGESVGVTVIRPTAAMDRLVDVDGALGARIRNFSLMGTPGAMVDEMLSLRWSSRGHIQDRFRTPNADVRVASRVNINLAAPGASIDGVALNNGDRVLIQAQTTPAENGIYVFNGAASAMTRATDADASAEVTSGMAVYSREGTADAQGSRSIRWELTTADPIVLGTTALTFADTGKRPARSSSANTIDHVKVLNFDWKYGIGISTDNQDQTDNTDLLKVAIVGDNQHDATRWQAGVQVGANAGGYGNIKAVNFWQPTVVRCKDAINVGGVQINVFGGQMGSNGCDYRFANPVSATFICGVRSEESDKLLAVVGSSAHQSMTLDEMLVTSPNYHNADRRLIDWSGCGVLALRNITLNRWTSSTTSGVAFGDAPLPTIRFISPSAVNPAVLVGQGVATPQAIETAFETNAGTYLCLIGHVELNASKQPTVATPMYFKVNNVPRLRLDQTGNLSVGGDMSTGMGGGVGVLGLANATTVPATNPVGGPVIYGEGGHLKARSTDGTVTNLSQRTERTVLSTPGAGSYTVPSWPRFFRVETQSGGSGGGAGRRGAAGTARVGGGAGASGGYSVAVFSIADLGGAGATVNYGIGAGGAGAAAVTSDDTDGGNGTAGGPTWFGPTQLTAYIGASAPGAGVGGTLVGGVGGGGTGGSAAAGVEAGSAGGAASTTGAAGSPGIAAYAGSGGGGGGVTSANVQNAGGLGGHSNVRRTTSQPAAGTAGGGAGADASNVGAGVSGQGGAGGGGNAAGAGGDGGDGAFGAGGGGGGASTNGSPSGAGGNGGNGYIVITAWG